MFRNIMKEDTPFAKEIKDIMASGKLVSDSITSKIAKLNIKKEIDAGSNIILDGYPRTLPQVDDLDKILKELDVEIDAVINFEIDESLLLERLTNRRICPKCKKIYHLVNLPPNKEGVCDNDNEELIQRPDDYEDKVKIRLETYHELTKPIINVYRDKKILIDVDGSKEPSMIKDEITKSLKK
jgi:adenylate kinase